MSRFGGSWSESKLNCVQDYARRYLQVMHKQPWANLHYVDAFAGRGKQALTSESEPNPDAAKAELLFQSETDRADTEGFLEGSALRALKASASSSRRFDRFMLIDAHKPSCQELRATIEAEYPEMLDAVEIRCEDANVALKDYLKGVNWRATRSLVFLDPFGLEVRWSTIERLAKTGACDVWYLFPLGGVIRMMTNSGQVPDLWRARLDEVFGTPDWYQEFYRATQASLFGDTAALKDASTSHVVDYIRRRLNTVFPAVSKAGVLRNSKGFPLFALILGVANPGRPAQEAALRIGNHLVRRLSVP